MRGSWGRPLWLSAYQALHKCLAQHPAGVLLDLRGLDDPGASSAPLWLTAAAQGTRMDPTVRVAASLPADTRLAARLGLPPAQDVLPVFATVQLARSFLASRRPLTSQMRLQLPPDPSAAPGARQVVSEACTGWGMPRLVPRARIVVSELVVNAAEHAGTPIDVLISRRGPDLLHLVVVDGDPALPPMPGGDEPPLDTLLTERGTDSGSSTRRPRPGAPCPPVPERWCGLCCGTLRSSGAAARPGRRGPAGRPGPRRPSATPPPSWP
ncbi:hypothetical protein GCM10010112_38020 [Actinoplanes lobatus]|uniref:Anti-sigma regulatory factor (Ser/Thr protein kinase) n=1 Tax=Actinoplanes lobatus TaxID=113568 RepID=A0ABQ4ALR2_9ACTN|nr:hypothetical protein GCM10010112_38020 [Actinoplanes lobatus]GIE41950.1 hypothetical protein Alo02nite_48480 [Actinoplanes lobatus]